MLASILNRITGVASIAGIVLIAAWLVCLALGRDAYSVFVTYAASPLGLLVWFGLSLAGFVHLLGGIRHLIWDLGIGFKLKSADALATWSMIIGVVLTLAFWALLFASHKVSL